MENPLHTNQTHQDERLRLVGLYKGRIEQRTDPLRLGRLRVRVEGVFDQTIAVDQLPWFWPKQQAWKEGGWSMIPPVGEYVWVQFECGDYEYPVWENGFWGLKETPQGKNPIIRQFPTSWYGSQQAWQEGPLALSLEKVQGVKPEDAPNLFGFCSPLGKRFEADDRRLREKVMVADKHDNHLWINTEDAVITLEAGQGNRAEGYLPRGITFSSNVREQKLAVQLYTHRGWRWTVDDVAEKMELAAPSGAKLRLTDTADARKFEVWIEGYHLILDPSTKSLKLLTDQGVGVTVSKDAVTVRGADDQQIRMDLGESREILLTTPGNVRVHAGEDLVLTAEGKVTVDGRMGVYLNSHPFEIPEPHPVDPAHTMPDTLPKVDKASDYPYYADPERS